MLVTLAAKGWSLSRVQGRGTSRIGQSWEVEVAGLGRKEGKQEDAHHRRRHREALPEHELLLLIIE
jgi:hypothetical protein